ncbi:phosphate signaling complex protein PhoU [Conexibacter arvalis]|uniref:Phosphate-specific transport system accessory protein PhoU n=1 Tax=Conexibacter arvalis TaxID=912552 RepID=A0A840IKD9_9ACTN|nr:phosphate signaling complex protein PhoU [Conexibacter arvalis]MBB4664484.1 phosphate transport system protein [Conexibacter arvalis]
MAVYMVQPRQEYLEQLAQIERQTLTGLDLVVDALDRALVALREHDVELASAVVADDDSIDTRYVETHQAILSLLALQAPVAGDLRVVAALLHVIRHVERMGDQCVTVAKLVPLDDVAPARDAQLLDRIARMGALVRGQVLQAQRAFGERDHALAQELVTLDREVNALNREIFTRAVEIGDDPERREWAMHMALVARCLERIGDNAVDVGEQTAFVVTGRFREFSDASQAPAPRPE